MICRENRTGLVTANTRPPLPGLSGLEATISMARSCVVLLVALLSLLPLSAPSPAGDVPTRSSSSAKKRRAVTISVEEERDVQGAPGAVVRVHF